MTIPALTTGVCERMMASNRDDDEQLFNSRPYVQVLSIKKVNTTAAAAPPQGDRYRVILSDGKYFVQSMLATQLNELVERGVFEKNAVICLEKFTVNLVQNKRLTIILGASSMGQATEKIGNPESLEMQIGQVSPAVQAQTPSVAPAQQQVRQTKSNGGERPPPIVPIEHLSPYNNKWTIKARVTQKSDIRTYSNNKGDGKLFSVNFMDETGEIKATGFNSVVDEFYDRIQEGKVYFVSRARVGVAKKKFSNLTNEYELSFERNTEIEECLDVSDVPEVKYTFIELGNLLSVEKDSICDVIGVIKDVGDLSNVVTKTQKSLPKRELNLVDQSGYSCQLTLWGKQAENFHATDQPVIAFKGVKVGDFRGRSLSAQSSSTMVINPDIPEGHALRGWFDSSGVNSQFQTHSSTGGIGAGGSGKGYKPMIFADVKGQQLGANDRTDFFSARATSMHVKPDSMHYPACPSEGCNKKVYENHDGWRCEKCDRSYPEPEHRYIISMAAADMSDQAWLQGFNDIGKTLFGMTADEMVILRNKDEKNFQRALRKAPGRKFVFECRAKTDTYNDSPRIRYGIMKLQEVDFKAQCYSEIASILRYPAQSV